MDLLLQQLSGLFDLPKVLTQKQQEILASTNIPLSSQEIVQSYVIIQHNLS